MARGLESVFMLIAAFAAGAAYAHSTSSYPVRPVRIVVPQSPGASTDLTARLLAQRLTAPLGQTVIVDNRPGAGSIVGTEVVAKATPDVPTIAESGVAGYDHGPWNGFLAPAKTPRAIIARLNEETVRILNSPETKSIFLNEGAEPVGNKPEEFAAIIKSEIAKWAKVIQAAGIKAD